MDKLSIELMVEIGSRESIFTNPNQDRLSKNLSSSAIRIFFYVYELVLRCDSQGWWDVLNYCFGKVHKREGLHSVVICFNKYTFQCFSARKSPNLGMFKRQYNPHHWRANTAQSKWHGMLYLVLGLLQRCVPDRVSWNKRALSDSTLRYQKPVRLFTLRNAENTGTSSFQYWLAELY
jgi:hypothetical protein